MTKEKIYLGSDHAGFKLKEEIKEFLTKESYECEDTGPCKYDPNDDYPDYAIKLCKKVLATKGRGILICGSGQGMDRTANKIPGIYAAVCWDMISAKMAKEHANANVLCLGQRTVAPAVAKRMVKLWLESPFIPHTRHVRRINKVREVERRFMKNDKIKN